MRNDFGFAHLMKKILNFSIALEKEYNKKFVATLILDIVKT